MENKQTSEIDILIYHHALLAKGGEENKVRHLINVLSDLRLRFQILVFDFSDNTFPELINLNYVGKILEYKKNPFSRILNPFYSFFGFLYFLLRLIKKIKPRIILILSPHPPEIMSAFTFVSLFFKIPLIVGQGYFTLHTLDFSAWKYYGYSVSLFNKLFNRVLILPFQLNLRSCYLVLNSLEALEAMKKIKIYDRYRNNILDVIPPPYDDSFFYLNRNVSKRKYQIAMIGRFSPEKRFQYALYSLSDMKSKFPNLVRLKIVGQCQNKHYVNHLNALIGQLGLEKDLDLVFDGRPVIIRKVLWKSQVYWDFSLGAFGIANAEALACGCVPIVPRLRSSSVGPYGLVYDNWCEVVDLTIHVFNNISYYQKKITEGAQWVRQNYSVASFKKKWSSLLEKLLSS